MESVFPNENATRVRPRVEIPPHVEVTQGEQMVDAAWMEAEVRQVYPDAEIECTDLTGNGDHWFVKVVDPSFEGMRPLPRQRPILSHFKQHIQANVVHALDLKCWTPEQAAEKEGDQSFHPHQQDDFVGIHVRRPSKE